MLIKIIRILKGENKQIQITEKNVCTAKDKTGDAVKKELPRFFQTRTIPCT